jgi:hypothetical protein
VLSFTSSRFSPSPPSPQAVLPASQECVRVLGEGRGTRDCYSESGGWCRLAASASIHCQAAHGALQEVLRGHWAPEGAQAISFPSAPPPPPSVVIEVTENVSPCSRRLSAPHPPILVCLWCEASSPTRLSWDPPPPLSTLLLFGLLNSTRWQPHCYMGKTETGLSGHCLLARTVEGRKGAGAKRQAP